MDNRYIGIFDSGVGGLSVLLEIQKLLPKESLLFVADQAFVPYGEKTKLELIDRVEKIVKFFVEKQVKAIVMACNTATVYTIDEIRQKFNIPIIGTVPAIKPLVKITKTKKVAVLSTPATTKSAYLNQLIDKYAGEVEVIKVSGDDLEEFVENGEIDSLKVKEKLKRVLSKITGSGVDAIALGCTHFPFLTKKIREVLGDKVSIIDSSKGVANRLKSILEIAELLSNSKRQDLYFTTGDAGKFKTVAGQLIRENSLDVSKIIL